jgi:hypothetical protein
MGDKALSSTIRSLIFREGKSAEDSPLISAEVVTDAAVLVSEET